MPVFQKTSIRFFKRFPTAMHSGKMYIRHLFRYGQLQSLATKCCKMRKIWTEKWCKFLHVIEKCTKFAGLYFPHFTTFRDQSL